MIYLYSIHTITGKQGLRVGLVIKSSRLKRVGNFRYWHCHGVLQFYSKGHVYTFGNCT